MAVLVNWKPPEEAEVLESELEGELNSDWLWEEHSKFTYLEQVRRFTDLLCLVTLPARTEHGKMRPGF